MKYTTFSNTDTRISTISFGCWELGGTQWVKESDEQNLKVIQTALDHGVTSFDTAEVYGNGHSEIITGQALKASRRQIFLASKVSPENLRPDDVRRALEASLKRLDTDYLDLYYIHWPNKEIPIQDTLAAFNDLKEQKLIRAIGVSNFNLAQLKEAMQYARIDALQNEYSLLTRTPEGDLLTYCADNDISFFSYSSLAKGLLTGAYHFGSAKLTDEDFRFGRRLFNAKDMAIMTELVGQIREIATAKGVSAGNVALSWLFSQRGLTSTLVGTQNEQHLLDNLAAVELELTTDELAVLDAASKRVLAEIDS